MTHFAVSSCEGEEELRATNLALDPKLIEAAVRAGRHKTKKAAATAPLTEYVRSHRRRQILKWRGQVDYFDDYDYKALPRHLPVRLHLPRPSR